MEQHEEEITPKAPRITLEDIEDNIVNEHYFTAQDGVEGAFANLLQQLHQSRSDTYATKQMEPLPPLNQELSLLTFCVLILRNGFIVTGESCCVSPENFNADIGKKIARENAIQKIWPLMGYALKIELSKSWNEND